MQIDLETRTVTLGVGEFAELTFGPSRSDGSRAGLWRARLGQAWHGEMQDRTRQSDPEARFEVALSGRLRWRGWTIRLNGRIDQVVEAEDTVLLREIKTVRTPLPATPVDLRRLHSSYFRQLAVYRALARDNETFGPDPIEAELTFIDIDSGITQSVPLGDEDDQGLELQLEDLWRFVERLRGRARAASDRRGATGARLGEVRIW